jgi:hypothetical protein
MTAGPPVPGRAGALAREGDPAPGAGPAAGAEPCYVVASCNPREALRIGSDDVAIALLADYAEEWGRAFAPCEPVLQVDYADGRTAFYSANRYYVQARPQEESADPGSAGR